MDDTSPPTLEFTTVGFSVARVNLKAKLGFYDLENCFISEQAIQKLDRSENFTTIQTMSLENERFISGTAAYLSTGYIHLNIDFTYSCLVDVKFFIVKDFYYESMTGQFLDFENFDAVLPYNLNSPLR